MHFFSHKKSILPLPDGCTPEQIQIESSICTGETTIGFYDATEKKLRYAELVKHQQTLPLSMHDMDSHRLTTRKKKTAAFRSLRQSFSISMFLYIQNLLL